MATAYTKSKILSKNNIDSKDYVTPREPLYPPSGVDVQKMLDMRKKMLDNIPSAYGRVIHDSKIKKTNNLIKKTKKNITPNDDDCIKKIIRKIRKKPDIIKRTCMTINKISTILHKMNNYNFFNFLLLLENTTSKNNQRNEYYWSLITEELILQN